MELVEVRARTLELAEQAALEEMGLKDRDLVEWEVLQEPTRGFLGVGRQDAIVRAKRKPAKRRRSRGGRGAKGSVARSAKGKTGREQGSRPKRQKEARPADGRGSEGRSGKRAPAGRGQPPRKNASSSPVEQAEVAKSFVVGLLGAVDMEGEVETRLDDDLVTVEIKGEETEVLVGPRGSGIEALHTIAKSVIKRKTEGGARLRVDIAGYGTRRREALAIYATGLIEQVASEGGELMLEPMNAADRKVIHDTVAKHDNMTSFSEGEAPQRYVVIAYVAADPDEE